MTKILLYGHLGKSFGREHQFEVQSPAEAFAALRANYSGFEQYMIKNSSPGYFIYVGDEAIKLEQLEHHSQQTIRVVPAIAGAGDGKSILSIVVGVLIMTFVPGGQGLGLAMLRGIGWSLIMSGVGGLLFSPPRQAQTTEEPENMPSYAFDGAVNTMTQGNPVPICYGRLRVGSQVISAGLSVEQLLPFST